MGDDPTADERRALLAARRNGAVTPRELRRLLPASDVDALLASALAKGLLTRIGRRGGARYVLSPSVRQAGDPVGAGHRDRQRLLDEIRRQGSLSATEGATLLAVAPHKARGLLNELAQAGLIRAEGRTRARRYRPA